MGSDVEGFTVQAGLLRLGDKHLPPLTFARSGIDDVVDDADDLDVGLRVQDGES
jgi:hypothetical protein